MRKLRVGVIGCGGMGSHLARQCANLENAQIVATCDIIAERAEKLGKEFGAKPFVRRHKLLMDEDVDAVIVATPNDTHARIVIDAARAGKHVFCEKPMALTLKDCDAMISAAESAGVKLMIGQVLRLHPVFWKTHEIIASGELGTPFGMCVARTGGLGTKEHDWRSKRKSCGGVLFEINTHEFDFMRHILGDAVEVYAQLGNFRSPQVDYEDLSFVTIKFASGAVGTLHSSIATDIGEYRNTIQCAKGTLISGGFGGPIQYRAHDGEAVTIQANEIERPEPYMAELASFVDAVTTGAEMVFDARDGRAAVEMAIAAYRSGRLGRPVKLPL